jgi:hypothetical protein
MTRIPSITQASTDIVSPSVNLLTLIRFRARNSGVIGHTLKKAVDWTIPALE